MALRPIRDRRRLRKIARPNPNGNQPPPDPDPDPDQERITYAVGETKQLEYGIPNLLREVDRLEKGKVAPQPPLRRSNQYVQCAIDTCDGLARASEEICDTCETVFTGLLKEAEKREERRVDDFLKSLPPPRTLEEKLEQYRQAREIARTATSGNPIADRIIQERQDKEWNRQRAANHALARHANYFYR